MIFLNLNTILGQLTNVSRNSGNRDSAVCSGHRQNVKKISLFGLNYWVKFRGGSCGKILNTCTIAFH